MSEPVPHSLLLCLPDPAIRQALLGMLEDSGWQVVHPDSEAEALQRAAETAFAAIVLDARGDATAALAIAWQLRAQPDGDATPLLFMSEGDLPNDRDLSMLGLADRLRAPVDAASLQARLRLCAALRRRCEGEARYRTLFERMDEGVCIVEVLFDDAGRPVDYRFLETNPAFVHQSGLIDARGRRMREMRPDHDEHWFEVYGEVAKTGEARRWQSESKSLNRWFDVYASRVGDPQQCQVAIVFNDISSRRASEERLRRVALDLTEADQHKTEFLATLAHELRNPLAPLRNGLELLRRAGDRPEVSGRALEIMERQLMQMTHLVDDLLDVARIASGGIALKKTRVDLKTVIASAVEASLPLIEAGHHRFSVRLPEEDLPLDADPQRMTQVVSNLLNNAAKYTPAGGHIELSALRHGDQVVMSIADNGMGIPEEALMRVFDLFAQVEEAKPNAQGGLGIGLTLVRKLVERHGGTVSVVSDGIGQGCLFTVRLPLAGTPAPAPAAQTDQEAQRIGSTEG